MTQEYELTKAIEHAELSCQECIHSCDGGYPDSAKECFTCKAKQYIADGWTKITPVKLELISRNEIMGCCAVDPIHTYKQLYPAIKEAILHQLSTDEKTTALLLATQKKEVAKEIFQKLNRTLNDVRCELNGKTLLCVDKEKLDKVMEEYI
jgi:hypothetical protein